MAIKQIRPGQVEVLLESHLQVVQDDNAAASAAGGVYPLISRNFIMDEYRLMAGWPVPIPRYDIRAETMISASGEIFTSRDDPTQIQTNAIMRWVADSGYDITATRWLPVQDETGRQTPWTTSSSYAPALIEDYQYRVNNEIFVRSALNFDSDARKHMWADFSSTIGGSSGYTVILVMSPNSVFGNNTDAPFNGLWCPGRPSPGTDTFTETLEPNWMSITVRGYYLFLETESKAATRGISISPAINSNAPSYVAIVFDRPDTYFYVGSGPSSIRVKSLPTGTTDAVPLDHGVTLGRTPGDVLHTADMALFDVGIYADRLTPMQISSEFAKLSQTYGGDS